MDGILVFSKSADPGSVKTRLRAALTDDQCLSFHLASLQDTLAICGRTGLEVYLFLAGSQFLPFDPGIAVLRQSGKDLGERMRNAAADMLKKHDRIVIIGTDCPMISPQILNHAIQELDDHDVVLGPSKDGGYYLLAFRTLAAEMFEGVHWGTESVLEMTLQKLKHRRVSLLEPLWDVDHPSDLERLRHELESNPALALDNLRAWFQENRW